MSSMNMFAFKSQEVQDNYQFKYPFSIMNNYQTLIFKDLIKYFPHNKFLLLNHLFYWFIGHMIFSNVEKIKI